jgi:hypothetical protein
MVPGNSIKPCFLQRLATEQISATHDEPNLHTDTHELPYFEGKLVKDFGVNAKRLIARQGLTAEL